MRPSEQLGDNIRARRGELELSQMDVALRVDMHATDISRLERGVGDPKLSTIVRVAGALECLPETLMARVGES